MLLPKNKLDGEKDKQKHTVRTLNKMRTPCPMLWLYLHIDNMKTCIREFVEENITVAEDRTAWCKRSCETVAAGAAMCICPIHLLAIMFFFVFFAP